jgi:hypothetical protein
MFPAINLAVSKPLSSWGSFRLFFWEDSEQAHLKFDFFRFHPDHPGAPGSHTPTTVNFPVPSASLL